MTRARAEGILASGPHPADTLFYRAVRGDFDIVVAMYHDQGHVPVKVLGLEAGVNITVGLPILRTSVDHGTAFDIAGKGIADEGSLKEAIRQAVALSSKGNVPRDDSAAGIPAARIGTGHRSGGWAPAPRAAAVNRLVSGVEGGSPDRFGSEDRCFLDLRPAEARGIF